MTEIFFAGGPIMYPLLLCSIIATAIIIERMIFWWQYQHNKDSELITQLCNGNKNAYMVSDIRPNLITRVLIEGLESLHSEASWRMQQIAKQEMTKVSRYQTILSTMVSLTPLLGIFGTVLGIIESFQLLGDASITDPLIASGGLAQALITTAFGLGIAILCLIAGKVFDSQSIKFHDDLEAYCTKLELSLGLKPQDIT